MPALRLPAPDGDGVNDVRAPVMNCDLRSMDLLVFNRWGELIAVLKEPADHRDGILLWQAISHWCTPISCATPAHAWTVHILKGPRCSDM